mgnify:CR=1 FL=1
MVYNGENPVSLSEMKAIEAGKGKPKEKEEPKEKKIAHSTAKTEGKPSKLAPPTGWNDPNPQKKQSAQNFINLLDLDDEEERQVSQQPQTQQETQITKPTETFVSKPKAIIKEQPDQPTMISGGVTSEKKVDLLDFDFGGDSNTTTNNESIPQQQQQQ